MSFQRSITVVVLVSDRRVIDVIVQAGRIIGGLAPVVIALPPPSRI